MYGFSNRIDLWKCTTSKKCCYNSKEGKYFCQPFELFTHSILNIVHWSAGNLIFFIFHTEFYSQECFRIFCRHSKKCGHPHPEHRSRSADSQCRCHTYDTTGSNIGRKRRTKCWKFTDLQTF